MFHQGAFASGRKNKRNPMKFCRIEAWNPFRKSHGRLLKWLLFQDAPRVM
jgi:hypothetical protein